MHILHTPPSPASASLSPTPHNSAPPNIPASQTPPPNSAQMCSLTPPVSPCFLFFSCPLFYHFPPPFAILIPLFFPFLPSLLSLPSLPSLIPLSHPTSFILLTSQIVISPIRPIYVLFFPFFLFSHPLPPSLAARLSVPCLIHTPSPAAPLPSCNSARHAPGHTQFRVPAACAGLPAAPPLPAAPLPPCRSAPS